MSHVPLAILFHLIIHSVLVCFGQNVSGRHSLSVVISAGQPLESVTRIREVAVIIHGLTDAEKRGGKLFIYGDKRRERKLLKAPLRILTSEESLGSIKVFTGLYFRPTSWRNGSFPTGDVSYFSEVRFQKRLVVEGCLRVQPRWMEELYPQIRRLPLLNMTIPSTHHSGAYKVYSGRDIGDPFRDCQEEDVFTQLLYGIRALDVRVAVVGNESSPSTRFDYLIDHERFPTKNSLRMILEDVRDFLDLFPKEVVFVDFHEFPVRFENQTVLEELAELGTQILGPHLYNGTHLTSATMENVVRGGKRAIVTVDHVFTPLQLWLLWQRFPWLQIFPGIRHISGNTDNLDRLKSIITDRQIQYSRESWFYSSMAQITPQGSDAVLWAKYPGGVRGIAHRDNFRLSTWFRHHLEARTKANFIAFDFFASSDLVDLCKEINLERART